MRINFIIPSYGESGGLKVVYKYASEFAKQGHDVLLYYPLIPYNLGRDKSRILFALKKVKGMFTRGFHAITKDRYNSLCKEFYKPLLIINNHSIRNADVTIATAWPTAYTVAKLHESKGRKFYFIQDFEIWDDFHKGIDSYKLPLKKVVISQWILDKLREVGIYDEIPIVRNGIDKQNFYYGEKHKKDLTCLMLYHDLEKKGVKYGIEAFKKAKAVVPNLRLKMFGLGIPKSISIKFDYFKNPPKAVLAKLYADADIFIYPSIEEGWGLTVIEAMLSGCVVVGTNTGCLTEVGQDQQNCLISNPRDIDKMADNIIKICNNSELRERLSINAMKVSNDIDWDKSINRFISILSENVV